MLKTPSTLNSMIPSVVNINSIKTTVTITPSLYPAVLNCSYDITELSVAHYNNNLEHINNNFSEGPN